MRFQEDLGDAPVELVIAYLIEGDVDLALEGALEVEVLGLAHHPQRDLHRKLRVALHLREAGRGELRALTRLLPQRIHDLLQAAVPEEPVDGNLVLHYLRCSRVIVPAVRLHVPEDIGIVVHVDAVVSLEVAGFLGLSESLVVPSEELLVVEVSVGGHGGHLVPGLHELLVDDVVLLLAGTLKLVGEFLVALILDPLGDLVAPWV